ncbi:TIGR03086 family metal-binding protein [Amycolatopsis thermophila]|uniref:Uncharacterized protein (TIGR03086 family) n=1 Tax=Amycolatopsis thermophila TaxID=206084 RepID=A0ABU0F6A0_9PSEU|nr:TIGR03086 family metal-binding protein [Amycolatopsis thermophila]MDQ0383120.1 uncharacterized protein (TIGR03086 family) [Amycolatopsis thermophila]
MLEQYRRAQDGMDAVLAAVPRGRWDEPSMCAEWTVRDVAGHVVWGQWQMRAWATGEADPPGEGAPGAPHPGTLAGDDPLETWRKARAASVPALTPEALARTTRITGLGEVPLAGLVPLMITDTIVHSWDIGHALGIDVRPDADLVALADGWGRAHVVRRPGFFGPEVTAPPGADELTRMLAFLGRVA